MAVTDLLVDVDGAEAFVYNKKPFKEPPLDNKNASVIAILKAQKFLHGLRIDSFPKCCAISIIHSFEFYDQFTWNIFNEQGQWLEPAERHILPKYSKDAVLSAAVYRIKDKIDDFIIHAKPTYLLAAFNQIEIKSGIRDVLVDYFGFVRLENDFVNYPYQVGQYSRICLLGLCCTGFQESNL